MISYLKGELVEINFDNLIIDVNGIGYMVYVPSNTMDYLPNEGEQLKIHTYLYIREDAMILYGFLTKDDLEIFKLLITVNGIGPKGALAVLSTISADNLRFAILSGDAKTISKAPGIGAKTAQRVILDLKDKLSLEEAFEKKLKHESEMPIASKENSIKNDAVLALEALGYSQTDSLKAVSQVEITNDMDVEDVLRNSLKFISGM